MLDVVLLGRQSLPTQLTHEAVTAQMNAIDVALQIKVRCEGLGALLHGAHVCLRLHYY